MAPWRDARRSRARAAVARSTPPGQHRPVLRDEVLAALQPRPGMIAVDCTVGFGGHSIALLERLGPGGLLIGVDLDQENLERARARLTEVGHSFVLCHGNFAGLPAHLATAGQARGDLVLADLGMSSMQLDDPERGFSYARDGVLDMRMDRSRGRTAAEVLASLSEADLATALAEIGDEPRAAEVAGAIASARAEEPIARTSRLAQIVLAATGSAPRRRGGGPVSLNRWNNDSVARVFQTLRILTNREYGNLIELLRVLPDSLAPGGRVAIISFHSGEDRLVKKAFRAGVEQGIYQSISPEPIRPTETEKAANPRARSAKLRVAVKATA